MTVKVKPPKPRVAEAETLYTYAEVAERFAASGRQVKRWCDEGRLGFIRMPQGRRITERHIQDFIEANDVPAER